MLSREISLTCFCRYVKAHQAAESLDYEDAENAIETDSRGQYTGVTRVALLCLSWEPRG